MALERESGRVQEGESLWPPRVGQSIWTSCAGTKNRDPGVSSKQDARDGLHGSLGNHPTFSHEARGLTLQYPC